MLFREQMSRRGFQTLERRERQQQKFHNFIQLDVVDMRK